MVHPWGWRGNFVQGFGERHQLKGFKQFQTGHFIYSKALRAQESVGTKEGKFIIALEFSPKDCCPPDVQMEIRRPLIG